MALITWKNEFNIGVPSVDAEHRQLIELINEIHSNLKNKERKFYVDDFLGEIYAKIAAHFALEEKWMSDNGYDQFLEHKAEHEKLLDDIRDIMDAYEDKENFDEGTLSDRLSSWFTGHFGTMDARLHKFQV
jgi:hemerythrin-like metal-binding protein